MQIHNIKEISRTRTAIWQRHRRVGFRNAGLCSTCGGRRDSFWLTCWRCRNRVNQAREGKSRTLTAEQKKKQRYDWVIENKCTSCGKQKPDSKYSMCYDCRTYHRNYYRNFRKLKIIKHSMKLPMQGDQ